MLAGRGLSALFGTRPLHSLPLRFLPAGRLAKKEVASSKPSAHGQRRKSPASSWVKSDTFPPPTQKPQAQALNPEVHAKPLTP